MPKKKDQVYIVSNPLFRYYKIGRTQDYQKRERTLNNTNIPIDYKLIMLFENKNTNKTNLEQELHKRFAKQRLRNNREFFTLTSEDLMEIRRIAIDYGYSGVFPTTLNNLSEVYNYLKDDIFESYDEFETWWEWFQKSCTQYIPGHNQMCEYHAKMDKEEGYFPPDEYEDKITEDQFEEYFEIDKASLDFIFVRFPHLYDAVTNEGWY